MNDLSVLLTGTTGAILGYIIVGGISIIITIMLILAIFHIEKQTKITADKLTIITQQLEFLCQSLDYQNKVTAQKQNTSSGSSSTLENNNRY